MRCHKIFFGLDPDAVIKRVTAEAIKRTETPSTAISTRSNSQTPIPGSEQGHALAMEISGEIERRPPPMRRYNRPISVAAPLLTLCIMEIVSPTTAL